MTLGLALLVLSSGFSPPAGGAGSESWSDPVAGSVEPAVLADPEPDAGPDPDAGVESAFTESLGVRQKLGKEHKTLDANHETILYHSSAQLGNSASPSVSIMASDIYSASK